MDEPAPTAPTAADDLTAAQPAIPSLDLAVAKARAATALFGAADAVKIGRYRIIERLGAGGMGVVWSAWDPELGRAVALKLASSGSSETRARARDEGRALARLSHPNVVPIYDVLEHDERVFLVMELVKGRSLRQAARERAPLQIVRDYRQACDGLAAAHAAGLIHRDFKPDNAVLGADGRVRVLDFGLAHAADATDGTVAGTPGYMAPEQEAGAALSPAVDQFALAVSLREALAARGGVPRWIAPVLERAGAAQAADRFPSMAALGAALARDPAWRWRRRALIGGAAAAVAAAAGAFALGRAQTAPTVAPCSSGSEALAGAWGPDRRAAIGARLVALATPYAADSAPRVLAALDAHAASWLALARSSCLAHARRELTDDAYQRRGACLHRPRAALGAAATLAERIEARELPGLVQAVSQLPSIAACADDAALQTGVAPPPVEARPALEAVQEQLGRSDVLRDAGKYDDARAVADGAVAAADALGYRPAMARAHLARGRVALEARRDDLGRADFDRAVAAAVPVGELAIAVEAYARRAYAITSTARGPGELGAAVDGLSVMLGLGEAGGAGATFADALLYNNLGAVARRSGAPSVARAAYRRADHLATGVDGPGAIELTAARLNLMQLTDDADQRVTMGEAVVAQLAARLGPTHPRVFEYRCLTALADDDPAAVAVVLGPLVRDALALHPDLVEALMPCATTWMWSAALAGDREGAAAAAAVVGGPGASSIRAALAAGFAALAGGDLDDAIARLRRTAVDADSAPGGQAVRVVALLGLAIAETDQGGSAAPTLDQLDATLAAARGASPALLQLRRAAVATLRARSG